LSKRAWEIPTGTFIRDLLLAYKEAYAYEIWKALRDEREKAGIIAPTYHSFRNYMRILRRLGLIRLVRVERAIRGWPRRYFAIVPGMEDHPAWYHPQVAFYPLTQLGAKDYARLKREAEEARVKVGTYYIRTRPDRVESLAKELGVSRGEIERRIRRPRSPPEETE